jgi:hypothetical protein
MSDNQPKATEQVRELVDRAQVAIRGFWRDGINAEDMLMRPHFQWASLKAAREDLSKAIAIIEGTKWERTI